MATKNERLGTSTEKIFHVLCYEHHSEMLLESEGSAETFLYVCREPGCFIHYNSSQGYSSSPKMGTRSESEIKPGVHCPKDERLCTREVRPEKKSFRLRKCPECDAIRTNGEIQVRQPLPANSVPLFRPSLVTDLSADSREIEFFFR